MNKAINHFLVDERLADNDTIEELINYHIYDLKEKLNNFELLDNIFSSFVKTAEFRNSICDFNDIINSSKLTKKYYKFIHDDISYLSSVSTIEGHDTDWVNIKLPNNGFHYYPKEGRRITRHGVKDCVILDNDRCMKYFTNLKNILSPNYEKSICIYNYKIQRLDLKFYPKNNNKHLIITYELGNPHFDA